MGSVAWEGSREMNFLLYCGAATQIIFVIVAFGGGSIAGLCLVRWLVPLDRLQKNHEVAGVTFGVLGAFYGLVLAFVIVAAWERFNQANTDALQEATALESLYKLGSAFSEPMRTQLDSGVLRYAHRVVDEEWPQMANNTFQPGKVGAHEMWPRCSHIAPRTAASRCWSISRSTSSTSSAKRAA